MGIKLQGTSIEIDRQIAAPSDAVWDVLTDLDAWPQWGLTVTAAQLDEGDVLTLGVTGLVWTPVGVPLPFTIDEFVPGRSWGWRVAGVSATRHGVDPSGDGCRLWMTAPLWAPAYLPVLAVALARIDEMARER
ncbi:SRPBCC family protein [Mycolicibacterium lacusdiani]|uniref:SRPBCC family protein n=1 Tax=Mycolicibacterium lacusdiani TaxID=2895283 RepID=UPI00355667A6